MSIPSLAVVNASPSTDPAAIAARRTKVRELAEQFESMLIAQMLRQMRQSMLSDDSGESEGLGSRTMTDTIDGQLALTLSRSSRLGLADFLANAIERQTDGGAGPARPMPFLLETPSAIPLHAPPLKNRGTLQGSLPPTATVTPPGETDRIRTLLPVDVAGGAAPTPPAGTETSAFGWRQDPITGQQRFHAGTDVRMAYGQGVRVAAGGRVASVGNQGGYGLTVVVDHGSGVETRYAHLSSSPIKPGDLVESGQIIAQSGNSGRSTGPHLHFEVLKGGQAVDPRSNAQLLAAAMGSD
jgi:murein DD-endopeptidase MepM/ murein hydrolase activator NlpD